MDKTKDTHFPYIPLMFLLPSSMNGKGNTRGTHSKKNKKVQSIDQDETNMKQRWDYHNTKKMGGKRKL